MITQMQIVLVAKTKPDNAQAKLWQWQGLNLSHSVRTFCPINKHLPGCRDKQYVNIGRDNVNVYYTVSLFAGSGGEVLED